MDNIQNKVIERYTKNIEFLAQKHPDVLNKLNLLEEAINTHQYQEKYALEYKDKYFDVMELASGNFLYNDNSIKISEQLSAQVNFNKDSYSFDGFPMFMGYEKYKHEFDDKHQGVEGIYPIMSYYLEHISPESQMKHIEKFIFIGVGLGLHIVQIDKKISADEYFIIEDNLELFRLSLFTTPYYQINAQLTFSINENKEIFSEKFKHFLSMSFFRNKHLKYSYFSAHSNEKIKLIKNVISSQVFASFPYKTLLEKFTRPLSYMKEGYQFVNLIQHFAKSPLSQKPLLIIAAGPSFSKNLQWLEKNHQNFTILAVSAVLKKLSELDIKPDIVTHLDGFAISKKHMEGFNAQEFLKESILLAGCFTPQEVLECFTKQNVFIFEELSTYYHDGFNSSTGPCVGSTAVFEALLMNIDKIYTLGLDLALADDGSSHAESHSLTKKTYDLSNAEELDNKISFRSNFFQVKGNLQTNVYTTPLFFSSLKTLNLSVPLLKHQDQHLYNLGSGAYIEGSSSLTIDKLDKKELAALDKKELHKELLTLLQQYSSNTLSQSDLESLKKRVGFAQEIRQVLDNYTHASKIYAVENYLYNLISLMLNLLQDSTREKKNLVMVYDYFLSYAMPIIFDFFNTKNLTDIQMHIDTLDKMLLDELYEIEKIYEDRINNFFEE